MADVQLGVVTDAPQLAQPISLIPAYAGQLLPPEYLHAADKASANRLRYSVRPPLSISGHPVQGPEDHEVPTEEVSVRFTNGARRSTRLSAVDIPSTADRASHVDFSRNYITRCEGLSVFHNAIRLTLRENELGSLRGISDMTGLRWIDASSNRLTTFNDLQAAPNLEWLDVNRNDIGPTLTGIAFAPNLTFLNLHNNRLKSLAGIQALTHLRYLDVSDNDITNVSHAQACTEITEINVAVNCISDPSSLVELAALPRLVRLNIFYNDLGAREGAVVDAFAARAPRVQVIVTEEESRRVGMNVRASGEGTRSSSCLCA